MLPVLLGRSGGEGTNGSDRAVGAVLRFSFHGNHVGHSIDPGLISFDVLCDGKAKHHASEVFDRPHQPQDVRNCVSSRSSTRT